MCVCVCVCVCVREKREYIHIRNISSGGLERTWNLKLVSKPRGAATCDACHTLPRFDGSDGVNRARTAHCDVCAATNSSL